MRQSGKRNQRRPVRPIPQVVHPSLNRINSLNPAFYPSNDGIDRCDRAPSSVSLLGLRGRKVMQNQRQNRYRRSVSLSLSHARAREHAHRRKESRNAFSSSGWEGDADETFVHPHFSRERRASARLFHHFTTTLFTTTQKAQA